MEMDSLIKTALRILNLKISDENKYSFLKKWIKIRKIQKLIFSKNI